MLSNYVNIPKEILQLHKMVSVAAVKMFVNRMAFIVSISRHIRFTTVQYISKSKISHIYIYLEKIHGVSYILGMYVEALYLGMEFENPRRRIPGRSTLNIATAAEHVPEIDQHIRVIKEQSRYIWRTLSFNIFPGRIFIEMILFVFLWLNSFLPVGGISKTYSLITIIAYCNIYYSNHCVVKFGAYLEIHEDTPPNNTIT